MVAEITLRVGLVDCVAQHLVRKVVLTADVDPGLVTADSERGDRCALDEHMRRVLHQVAVLGAARLGFVGVDDDVLRTWMVLGHERPFGGGWEVRASSPSQAGALDLVDHLRRGHLFEHIAQSRVAAEGFVDVELVKVRLREPFGQYGAANGPSLLSQPSSTLVFEVLYAPLPDPLPEGERGSGCAPPRRNSRFLPGSRPPCSCGR